MTIEDENGARRSGDERGANFAQVAENGHIDAQKADSEAQNTDISACGSDACSENTDMVSPAGAAGAESGDVVVLVERKWPKKKPEQRHADHMRNARKRLHKQRKMPSIAECKEVYDEMRARGARITSRSLTHELQERGYAIMYTTVCKYIRHDFKPGRSELKRGVDRALAEIANVGILKLLKDQGLARDGDERELAGIGSERVAEIQRRELRWANVMILRVIQSQAGKLVEAKTKELGELLRSIGEIAAREPAARAPEAGAEATAAVPPALAEAAAVNATTDAILKFRSRNGNGHANGHANGKNGNGGAA